MRTSSRSTAPVPRRSNRRPIGPVAALAALALVVGCAQPAPPSETGPFTVSGTATFADQGAADATPLVAASLWMLDEDFSETGEPEGRGASPAERAAALRSGMGVGAVDVSALRSGVVEVSEGLYLAGLGSVDADGRFAIALPDGDDLPSELLRPAEDAIPVQAYTGNAECTLTSSTDGVLASIAIFEGFSFAGPVFLTADGLGAAVATTEAAEIDLDEGTSFEGVTFASLIYASAATALTSGGDGCVEQARVAVDVDVDLAAGWNQLTWVYDADDGVTVRTRDADEPLFARVLFVGPFSDF